MNDPLSDVLSLLRVESMLTARIEVRGPWWMRFSAYRHMKFAGVIEGGFWLWIEGAAAPVRMEAGDFYLLTTGDPYCTGSDPTLDAVDGRAALAALTGPDGVARVGDSGERCVAAGGRFVFDDAASGLLLGALPPLIHVRATSTSAAPLQAVLDLLRLETGSVRPGASTAASSLATLVLVQILRAHLSVSPHAPGWLGALADSRIGAALGLMHADIARRWTVDDLASHVAMSRSSFAARFRATVGVPPLTYLNRWRMAVASRMLRETSEALIDIAVRVGYGSDAAFSAAFKQAVGCSPGRYRVNAAAHRPATAAS